MLDGLGRTVIALALAGCVTAVPLTESPRVAATGDNVDHYGRPTDPGARACYDQCMRKTDMLDTLGGSTTYKTDERQKATCWDRCAPRVKPKVCDEGETMECSCPDAADFAAPPLAGTRLCTADRTTFGGCDCTPKGTGTSGDASGGPAQDPNAPSSPTPDATATCKAAIKDHCVVVCASSPAADRGPCEVKCMREPIESYDGKLKECTPDLAGF